MADYTTQSDQAETTETNAFAAKATDLQALQDAVVDAASVSGGLWLSYLFALFYFAIAASAVTHRDLLLEGPVKLPFLNVELPLKYFFVLGPLVFLVVHAYVLLHFLLLASKVGAFHVECKSRFPVTGKEPSCVGNCRAIFSFNFSPGREMCVVVSSVSC
jgi:hypothetical protein